tara:strand:+ start:29 stop:232 length:204 start_codon:yes stop_codon:yes gene_type:complete
MKRMDLQIGKIERGQNGMEIYNSQKIAEDVEDLKIIVKNLENKVIKLEKEIENLQPDISEVEYPKER